MSLPNRHQVLGDLAACIGFYTRIPVSLFHDGSRPFMATQWAAPCAGALIGLGLSALLWVLLRLGVPIDVAAALTLAGSFVLTGGLHEDGLADTADGFGGGQTRERKLEIMRDSRIGSYGVLALIVSVLVRWAAICSVATASAPLMVACIVAAHAGSRAMIPALMVRIPPARRDGLSASAGVPPVNVAAIAAAIGIAFALLAGPAYAICATLLCCVLVLMVGKLAKSQIGGQTGDVAGALQQTGEIGLLVLAATIMI